MTKNQKEPINSSALRKATSAFTKQTDRGTAIIATAWIDDALEASLRAFFRRDKEVAEKMLQPDGPLGSFSSRIKMAYLLGIITSSLMSDLEIIRGIRNDFAHLRLDVRFTDQSIRDRCKSLVAAKAFQAGTGNTIRSSRQMFLISAFLATDCLVAYTESAKPPDTPELDLYGTVIHRMAKSASLSQMAETIKKYKKLHGG